jgi:hypothetical protein
MQTKTAKRWCLAAGAAVTLGVSTPVLANFPTSGGPGGLGTEVPFDSRLAREYFHYYVATSTPEALRIRDEVQKLHADHQAAMELGRAGAAAQNAEVRELARRIVDELDRLDWTLVRVANDSLIELSGTAYEAASQSWAGMVRDVQAASGPERDQRYLPSVIQVLESALSTVDQLQPQARDALRQQLGSVLVRGRKVLQDEIAAARALSSALAS